MGSLQDEVAKFEAWAATQPKKGGEWEVDYSEWSDLLAAAEEVIARGPRDDREIQLLLYALARDNECECIKSVLHEHPSAGMLVARAAISCAEPDARWQVAEFLGSRAEDDEARALLRVLIGDEDEYVRRRALLACARVDRDLARLTAVAWLKDENEYSRLAALSVLQELRAPELGSVIAQLEEDPSPYVSRRVAEIREEA